MPTGKYKTLKEHFEDMKKRLAEKSLTYREINLNTGIPEEVLRIMFSDEGKIITEISRLFEFTKIDLSSRHRKFYIYRHFDDGVQIKITRTAEPKASIYYDRKTQNFYNFSFTRKRFKESTDVNKELIINDMVLFTEDLLKNIRGNA